MHIFLANFYNPCFDQSEWKCLGVFSTPLSAKKVAIKTAFKSIDNFNVYDPAKRFFLEENNLWSDRWKYTLGIGVYSVEIRDIDSEDQKPIETLYLNLDTYIKKYIINNNLTSEETRITLRKWKNDALSAEFVNLFSTQKEHFMESDDVREKYGCVKPYPYEPLDPL